MDISEVTWELFEEKFREFYLSKEFMGRQLNKFNALKYYSCSVPEYEAHFMELLRYAPHLNIEKLRVNKFVYGLHFNIQAKPHTLHEAFQRGIIAKEEILNSGPSRLLKPLGLGAFSGNNVNHKNFQMGSVHNISSRVLG